MLEDMRESVRRMMEASVGALSPARAREAARSLMQGGNADQVRGFAKDLMEWSRQSGERVVDLVQREVKKQMKTLGLATRDDVDTLRKRVRELERGSSSRGSAKRSTRKRTTSKRSTAKRSTSGGSSSGGSSS